MIERYRKLGFWGILLGALMTVFSISILSMPLFIRLGPQGWFQFFVAMLGFWLVVGGITITIWVFARDEQYDIALGALLILGGLYLFVMSFVLSLQQGWLFLLSTVGLMCFAIGLSIYYVNFRGIFKSTAVLRCYFVKALLVVWIGILLTCFLLSWGAPVEFWAILDRVGVNIGEGSLLLKIHHFLVQFLSFSQETIQ
jgi:hypothetical protein